MKFFTLNAFLERDERRGSDLMQIAFDRYARHLRAMDGVLPPQILDLARMSGVDDGLVVRVRHDREAKVLTLILRVGDLQMGYFDLALTYLGASMLPEHEQTLVWVARTTKSDRIHQTRLCSCRCSWLCSASRVECWPGSLRPPPASLPWLAITR